MGFSATFGGPLLNALLGIGISFTVAFLSTPSLQNHMEVTLSPLLLSLLVFCVITLVGLSTVVVFSKFNLGKYHGIGMMVYYLIALITLIVVNFTVDDNPL